MTAKTAEDAAVLARAWKSERSSVNKVELIIEKDIVVIADQSQWLRSDCQEDRFRGSMIPLSCRQGKLGRGGGGGIADGHLLGVLGEVFICVGSRQYLAIHESYNYISTEEVFVGVYQI